MIVAGSEKTIGAVTPRLVCRVFLPLSCAVFFGGLVVASVFYFRDRPFNFTDMVISDLESPDENPLGYGFAAVGTAACAVLLLPGAILFHRRLRTVRCRQTWVGTALFSAGLAAAIAIGCLAPFTHDYSPVHIQLAFAAFVGICSGTLVWLTVAATPALTTGNPWGARLVTTAVLQVGVLLFLVYLYFTPHFFNHKGLLTSLAVWEWLLCVYCVSSLWILTLALDRIRTR